MKLEFHHINFVSEDVDRLHHFYTDTLGLADIPITSFPRPKETENTGYSGKIRFATDGQMQMLDNKNIPYSDYGTAFAKEWHQVFFHDPGGNIIEVHQQVS